MDGGHGGGGGGSARNVRGGLLSTCSTNPLTGFYRDGCCNTGAEDMGRHLVCAEMTAEFLAYSKAQGNDLSTPRPEYRFPGLKPGDRWCLCVLRWAEAWKAGVAPRIDLDATHASALRFVPLDVLERYALTD